MKQQKQALIFPVVCPTTNREVQFVARYWDEDRDGQNEFAHYRDICECGQEHFGSVPVSVLTT